MIRFRLFATALLTLPLAAQADTYEKDILPILKKNCFKCHNTDKMKAGVSVEVADMKSDVGRIIIPGDPVESMLYEVLVRDKDRMPPKGELSNKEVAKIREWIKAGAAFQGDDKPKSDPTSAIRKPLRGKWTNKAGKIIEADLLRVVDEKAILRMTNGKIYNYPLAELNEESAAKAREFAKE
jgi:hypothetical protein